MDDPRDTRLARGTPLWAWTLLTWLALATWGDVRRRSAPAARDPSHGPVLDSSLDRILDPEIGFGARGRSWPARPGVTALRSLPGLGDGRAVDLVRLRWARGPEAPAFDLSAVRGIGPATEARASAAWAERSGAPPGSRLRLGGGGAAVASKGSERESGQARDSAVTLPGAP